jgi:hypothetical protein
MSTLSARSYRQPDAAPLPIFRLTRVEQPFTNVGVDAVGPLTTQTNEKRWILLIICLNVRAIHLEVLRNMTAVEYALAFRRLRARRGSQKIVVCDRALQFSVLEAILPQLYEDEAEWRYIPSHGSWAGGVYERLVPLCKNAIYRTFRNIVMDDVQLQTIVLEIENILNNRPIKYVSEEREERPLTPNDFLRTRYSAEKPLAEVPNADTPHTTILRMWKQSRAILDAFWSLWHNDYLLYLRERTRSYKFRTATIHTKPKIGTMVLLREKNVKRNNWRMGRIIQLQYSTDKEVCSVVLELPNRRKVIRPVCDLYPLEIEQEDREITADQDIACSPDVEFDEIDTITCEIIE